MSSLHLKPHLHYPTAFKSLADFKEALSNAIAADDQRFANYLLDNFHIGDDSITFIGSTDFQHSTPLYNTTE